MKIVQVIPLGQKKIIIDALMQMEERLKQYRGFDSDNQKLESTLFDIMTLKVLMEYETSVSLSKEQHDNFTAVNKVDFPIYCLHN